MITSDTVTTTPFSRLMQIRTLSLNGDVKDSAESCSHHDCGGIITAVTIPPHLTIAVNQRV